MKQILPKPRGEVDLRFYAAGDCKNIKIPPRFSQHSAEPGKSASILQRNPHHSEVLDIKQSIANPSSAEGYNPTINTLSNLKQVQNREFAK